MKSARERMREGLTHAAKAGFTQGFSEGARHILAVLMGLPRPTRIIRDDSMCEVGEVALVAGTLTDMQEERLQKLDEVLQALNGADLQQVMQREVLNPVTRLEAIMQVLQDATDEQVDPSTRRILMDLCRGAVE